MKQTCPLILTILCILAMVTLGLVDSHGSEFQADRLGFDVIGVSRTTDMQHFRQSVGVRLSYDLTERVGLTLQADGHDRHGTLVDSSFAGLRFGFPLKWARPYVIGGVGLRFPNTEEYAAGGAGLEFKLSKSFRAFAEVLAEKGTASRTVGSGIAGLGFRF